MEKVEKVQEYKAPVSYCFSLSFYSKAKFFFFFTAIFPEAF